MLTPRKPWKQEIKKAKQMLLRREADVSAELVKVRETRRKLERILATGPRHGQDRLSPEGRAAISRAVKKRWRTYRVQKAKA